MTTFADDQKTVINFDLETFITTGEVKEPSNSKEAFQVKPLDPEDFVVGETYLAFVPNHSTEDGILPLLNNTVAKIQLKKKDAEMKCVTFKDEIAQYYWDSGTAVFEFNDICCVFPTNENKPYKGCGV